MQIKLPHLGKDARLGLALALHVALIMGGLVFLRTGRVPVRGEIVPHESGAEFEVMDADARRIKRLRVQDRPHRSDQAQ